MVTHSGAMDTSLTLSGTWVMNGASITFNDKTFAEVYTGSMMNTSLVKAVLFGYSGVVLAIKRSHDTDLRSSSAHAGQSKSVEHPNTVHNGPGMWSAWSEWSRRMARFAWPSSLPVRQARLAEHAEATAKRIFGSEEQLA